MLYSHNLYVFLTLSVLYFRVEGTFMLVELLLKYNNDIQVFVIVFTNLFNRSLQ
jgi:hypothetical protein